MNYIVFDLEWNQSPLGKSRSNERIPFGDHRDRRGKAQ